MKKCVEKIFIGIICFSLFFSNVSISANAGGASAAINIPKMLDAVGKVVVTTGVGKAVENLVDEWFSGEKEYYDAPGEQTIMDYYANNSAINKATGSISNSGANNENCYNTFSSTVTDKRTYSLIKDSYNTTTNSYTTMLYNPITNNYTELNQTSNIYYNNQYDTYYIENNEYNYYVTNNYTYVSYYITNNETNEESYYEIYYELPDGRNSYDLEKEDIWGEYFIYDVVGYESVQEDDGKTLALYHLDGDGKDSSYWKNYDITLGSGVFSESKFGQGLYTSNLCNTFKVSNFDINNFTLEFNFSITDSIGDYFYFLKLGSNYYDVSAGVDPGVYYAIIQVENGKISYFLNGSQMDVEEYSTFIYEEANKILPSGNCSIEIYNDGSFKLGRFCVVRKRAFHKSSDSSYIGDSYDFIGNYSYLLDEIRVSNKALYSVGSISVPNQPFDTNQVLVLPENPTENMIAVQGKYAVSDFRVGGVRPTYPAKGYVYIYLEDDIVKDIQQYEGDAWYSVVGAIYQNEEWHDLKEFDMSTYTFEVEEMPDDDSGGSSGDSGNDSSGGSVSGNGSDSSGSGVGDLLDGIGKIFDTILSLIGKIMGVVADFSQSVLDLFSGFTTFTDGFSSFLSSAFGFIPSEILNALTVGISLAVILAVVKFLRG